MVLYKVNSTTKHNTNRCKRNGSLYLNGLYTAYRVFFMTLSLYSSFSYYTNQISIDFHFSLVVFDRMNINLFFFVGMVNDMDECFSPERDQESKSKNKNQNIRFIEWDAKWTMIVTIVIVARVEKHPDYWLSHSL